MKVELFNKLRLQFISKRFRDVRKKIQELESRRGGRHDGLPEQDVEEL